MQCCESGNHKKMFRIFQKIITSLEIYLSAACLKIEMGNVAEETGMTISVVYLPIVIVVSKA
jgi:hypothetical protein